MRKEQIERLVNARDPRFRRIAEKMGYQTRMMKAAPVRAPDDDIEKVRAEYSDKMGKKAYHGWNVKELRAKMAEADKK